MPFLAHAAMEPMNCTVHVRKDGCDIWVGTQAPTLTQADVAELTGLPKEAVRIHNHLLGGGFGRRLDVDGTVLAVKIAQQVEGPVKVVWSREEDIQHDMYRPYYYDRLSAGLDADGKPVAWTHRVCRLLGLCALCPAARSRTASTSMRWRERRDPPYALPNIHVDYVRVEPPGIPTAFWRGVGVTHNVFVVESFIDELAARGEAGSRRLPQGAARPQSARARRADARRGEGRLGHALCRRGGAAASRSVRLRQLPRAGGRGRGRGGRRRSGCIASSAPSIAAWWSIRTRSRPRSRAASIFGLTAALHGAITLKDGRVEQSNFDNYLPMRIDEVPVVETHLVKSARGPWRHRRGADRRGRARR